MDETVTTDHESLLRSRLRGSAEVKSAAADDAELISTCQAVAELAARRLADGHCLYFFGNGGSSMDAGHLAAELVGRFYHERTPLAAVALSDHTAAMTAIGNDYAYEQVFARQLRAFGRAGDIAIGLSTSGNSPNVLLGLEEAARIGMTTVGMTGSGGGRIGELVDFRVAVPSDDTPRIQECHMTLGHTICELIELSFVR